MKNFESGLIEVKVEIIPKPLQSKNVAIA